MATQQGAPSRPWFRLATMARPPPPPPPTPQPDQAPPPPRPTIIRPAFSQTFRAPLAAPPQPPPPPPPPVAGPPSSPPSPTINPISHPPSPLALPSPQLKSYNGNQPEYEQKTVLVQENPKSFDNGRHKGRDNHNPNSTNSPKKQETSKKHSDSEDIGMRIITIAGENKGAIMDLGPFGRTTRFENNPHKLHMQKDNPTVSSDVEKSGSNSDGKSKGKNKNHKSKSPLMSAVMNSNVQGVNNSILFNSSTTHNDPGVHLSLSRKPNGGHGF